MKLPQLASAPSAGLTAELAAEREFAPIGIDELDWLCELEVRLHAFPWTRGNFLDSVAAGHGLWQISAGGRALGYAVVLQVLDELHLLNMGIAPEAQGEGHGRALLEWLAQRGRADDATQFFLEVRPSNAAALRLYSGLGFSEIGRRRRYYRTADGREDAIVMRRLL